MSQWKSSIPEWNDGGIQVKIAVFGGSFNPIHIGHLALADEVCVGLGYDKVIFVPTFIPPHKNMVDSIDVSHRLEMVRLACARDERFLVDSCEIDRGGTSYTFDTVCHLEEKYSGVLEGKLGLVMGDDLLPGFHLWHRAQELARKCDLILARRPQSFDAQKSIHDNSHKGQYGEVAHSTVDENGRQVFDISSEPLFKDALCIKNPELVISSTDVRKRSSEGRSFKYLVPEDVFKYIVERNIYGNNK